MNSIKVDILLPVYNGVDFLKAQITSILDQTHANFNLIIRDDQSTDGSALIIHELSNLDSRILIVDIGSSNIGLVKSIEYLLKISESPYIMFADQDDVWLNNKVELFLNKATEISNDYPCLIHSDCFVTDKNLNVSHRFMGSKPFNSGLAYSLFHFYVQGSSTMINQKLKNEALPFPVDIYLHDRYLHIVSEICGIRLYLDTPTMYYRQHEKNLVGSKTLFEKIRGNILEKKKFYLIEDRALILSILENKYTNNDLLKKYKMLTDDQVNRFFKLYLLIKYKISLRWKERFLLLFKN